MGQGKSEATNLAFKAIAVRKGIDSLEGAHHVLKGRTEINGGVLEEPTRD